MTCCISGFNVGMDGVVVSSELQEALYLVESKFVTPLEYVSVESSVVQFAARLSRKRDLKVPAYKSATHPLFT